MHLNDNSYIKKLHCIGICTIRVNNLSFALILQKIQGIQNDFNWHIVEDLTFLEFIFDNVKYSFNRPNSPAFLCPSEDGLSYFLRRTPVDEDAVCLGCSSISCGSIVCKLIVDEPLGNLLDGIHL